jgi:hypothetical protein
MATTYSQSGLRVAETTCTAGTSFAARIKRLNNKSMYCLCRDLPIKVPVCGEYIKLPLLGFSLSITDPWCREILTR